MIHALQPLVRPFITNVWETLGPVVDTIARKAWFYFVNSLVHGRIYRQEMHKLPCYRQDWYSDRSSDILRSHQQVTYS